MSAYRFRLDTLLRLRRAEEQAARYALAAANASLRAAEALVKERRLAYDLRSHSVAPVPALDFKAEFAGDALSAQALRAAERARIEAANRADERLGEWQRCRTRVAVLERLDDRRRAEHMAIEQRAEAREVDDIVSTRWSAGDASQRAGANGGHIEAIERALVSERHSP